MKMQTTILFVELTLFVLHIDGEQTGESPSVSDAINKFSMDFLKQLETGDNVVFSPLSIGLALGMALKGAGGSTESEIRKALYLNGISTNEFHKNLTQAFQLRKSQSGDQLTLDVANLVVIKEGFEVKKDFELFVKKSYEAKVLTTGQKSGQETQTLINNFVSDKTHKLIPKLFASPIDLSTVMMILVNAIYLKATWRKQFDPQITKKEEFNNLNGIKDEIDTMYIESRFRISHCSKWNVTFVQIPYHSHLSMNILIPDKKYGLEDLLKVINHNGFEKIRQKASGRKCELYLPKFDIEYQPELKKVLMKLGLKSSFEPQANFSGIASSSLYISDTIHKAVIHLNEYGTEAAATTALHMSLKSLLIDDSLPLVIRVDRPFLYVIRDDQSSINLFVGAVKNLYKD